MNTLTDMDGMFSDDMTLDDVADLPSFINSPGGRYICQIPSIKKETYVKDGSKMDRIRIIYQIVQIEGTVGDEPAPNPGDLISETFTANGLEYFKRRIKGLLPTIQGITLGQIFDYLESTYTREACVDILCTSATKDGYTNISITKITPVEFVPLPDGIKSFKAKSK